MYFPNEILLDKRKSLTIFGGEDRGRYVYQSDAFHRYNGAGETKFNSNVFFDELGTPASLEKYRNVKLSKDEVELYEFCKKVLSAIYYYDPRMNAPEKLDLVLLNFKKQLFVASLLEEDIANKDFCEIGAGVGFLAAILMSKKVSSITLVDAIIPIIMHQQLFLSMVAAEFGYSLRYGERAISENSISIIPAWRLNKPLQGLDYIIGVNVFDSMNSLDFNSITEWMISSKEKDTRILAVGGFERAGLPPQYLFGFGGFLEENVQATFQEEFACSLCVSDQTLLLSSWKSKKCKKISSIEAFEVEQISSFWLPGKTAILSEPNADFLSVHKELLDQLEIQEVRTFSPTTAPIAGTLRNKQVTVKSDLDKLDRIIVASYRGEGIVNNPKISGLFTGYAISERLTLLEKAKT